MGYIGRAATNAGSVRYLDNISSGFDGSDVTFTAQVAGVSITPGQENINLYLDGVFQHPGSGNAYTISGSTITFTAAPVANTVFTAYVVGEGAYLDDATVITAKIGDDAITAAKLDDDGTGFQVGDLGVGGSLTSGDKLTVTGRLRASAGIIGALTGNATTATTLATARTIGGVSFDGSANIAVTLAATATTLATARAINGVDFNGSAAITVTAAAGTLSGATLKSTVVASSLTSVGTLTALTTSGTAFIDGVVNIKETGSGHVVIENTQSSKYLQLKSNEGIYFTTNSANHNYIDSSNKFHISSLQVNGTSGTNPVTIIKGAVQDTVSEFIRVGRSDSTARYHSIKTLNSATGANNYLSFEVHDASSTTATTEVLKLKGDKSATFAGNVGIGTASPTTKIMGSDNETNNTAKEWQISSMQYASTAESEGWCAIQMYSDASDTILRLGGSRGTQNASTQIGFYTAANTTTRTGTERMRITSAGNVMLGNQTMTDHTNQTLGLKGTSQSGVSAITFLTTSSPTAGRSFAWASNYTAHGAFDLRSSENKDGTPFHHRILGIEGDTGHTTFLGRIQVGTFPQSTTNASEAWIGRAADRQDGTLTVQLGGNSATDTKFEIVDRGWSKVMFQVSGEAPSGAFNLNSNGTIATASNVSGDYAMFVNQQHSTGWGLRIAGGADSGDYIIRGQNGSGNDRFLVTSDGALEIRSNMLIERSVWDEPQIRLDPSSNYEFRIGNYGTSGSKKFGIKNNDGTIIMESSGNNGSNFWFGGDVSAASFTDRTPYPETLKIAYDVLASHKKLDDYDKNDKEHQLDHTKLHDFAKPQITVSTGLPEDEVVTKELGQDGRDASAVISCLVEVVNDLKSKVTALENA